MIALPLTGRGLFPYHFPNNSLDINPKSNYPRATMAETTFQDPFADLDLFAEKPAAFVPAPCAKADLPADWEIDEDQEEDRPRHQVSVDLWPPKLPLEIALCQTVEDQIEVVEKFKLEPRRFERICAMPEFRRAVSEATAMVRESGYTFKMKCRAVAEDFIGDLDLALHNGEIGLSTKLDIFKTLTRLGDLEPAKQKAETGGGAPTVNIQINI